MVLGKCPILKVGDDWNRLVNALWYHLYLQFLNGGGLLNEG